MAGRSESGARLVQATPAALYRAMVTASLLEQWLPPAGMTGRITRLDAHPGGLGQLVLRRRDAEITHELQLRFVELVPDRRVVQTITLLAADPRFALTMMLSCILTPLGAATEIRLILENLPPALEDADPASHIQAALHKLARLVER